MKKLIGLIILIVTSTVLYAYDMDAFVRTAKQQIGKPLPSGYQPGAFSMQYVKQIDNDTYLMVLVNPETMRVIQSSYMVPEQMFSMREAELALQRTGFRVRVGDIYECRGYNAVILTLFGQTTFCINEDVE